MRLAFAELPRGQAFPQPYRHGPSRLWPRRIQVFRLPAAEGGRSASHGPLSPACGNREPLERGDGNRPTLSRSEEHTSELQSLMRLSYAVFCLKKTKQHKQTIT